MRVWLRADADFLTEKARFSYSVVALRAGRQYLTVDANGAVSLADGAPGEAQSFQWTETPTGELVLMSIANNRFLRVDPASRRIAVDSQGSLTESADGTRFI
ncbi:hypothetical protein [Pseudoduganella umbonata]|uniref:Uncharacterized protein n=1 Tax=Pseudoduganella umbonata TaxID=864828 RepID=A0A4P8HT36_9BURK|nr:hypothetical protein [Pseudoduganella umbonata]MBB3220690.1 hypothetical protein [Pseudoduganella umbonata]QCP11828.1 hypothetical protein FCL38_16420 [Pseudoduganella umbonata]